MRPFELRLPIPSRPSASSWRHLALALCALLTLIPPLLGQTPNPVPFVNQPLVPASVAPGGPDFTLTVNGAGFVPGSLVNWNGSPRPTAFVSSTQINAAIAASDVAADGTAWVTVVNPGPGGGASNLAFFQATDPTASVTFNAPASVASWSPYDGGMYVATGDFNGDKELDLAVVHYYSDSISMLLGKGDGTFQPPLSYQVGMNPYYLISGDFNLDGKPDLVVANYNAASISLLVGNGDGTFQPHVDFATGVLPISLASGDFNGDGKLDLAVISAFSGTVSVFLGNGDGTFQPRTDYLTFVYEGYGNHRPVSVATGDINLDGKLDLAVADEIYGAVYVLPGNGDGTFRAPTPYATAPCPVSVVPADFNGDAKPDLVTTNLSEYRWSCAPTSALSLLLGQGNGTFQTHVDYDAGSNSRSVAVGDFNGDGNLDLVRDSLPFGDVYVLLGNGDGTFQASLPFPAGERQAYSVAAGDFNDDGRLDIAAVSYGEGFVPTAVYVVLQPSPVSPLLMVAIDIKPGDAANTINLKSAGTLPAAILGSATFDPLTVDPETVTLAGAHVARRGKGVPMSAVADVNHDGYPDLLLHFRTRDLQLTPASTEAVMYGETYSGQRIRGADAVRIVPPALSGKSIPNRSVAPARHTRR